MNLVNYNNFTQLFVVWGKEVDFLGFDFVAYLYDYRKVPVLYLYIYNIFH